MALETLGRYIGSYIYIYICIGFFVFFNFFIGLNWIKTGLNGQIIRLRFIWTKYQVISTNLDPFQPFKYEVPEVRTFFFFTQKVLLFFRSPPQVWALPQAFFFVIQKTFFGHIQIYSNIFEYIQRFRYQHCDLGKGFVDPGSKIPSPVYMSVLRYTLYTIM